MVATLDRKSFELLGVIGGVLNGSLSKMVKDIS